MKICIIGTSAESAINFRKELIEEMLRKRFLVYVFATNYSEKEKSIIKAWGAIPVDYSFSRAGKNPFSDLYNTIKLKAQIDEIKPDILFSYFSKPVIFSTLAARLSKVPRIVGMLEGLGYSFTPSQQKNISFKKYIIKAIQIFLYKLALRFLSRIIFLNTDDPHDLLKKYNISVRDYKILGGIGADIEYFSYTSPTISPIRFIFIGRALAEKGIHEFINSAQLVKKKYPGVEFIFLGGLDPSNPGSLNASNFPDLLKNNTIIAPGHVENIREWLNNSSVFVLPSYREGVPRSTQEAMAVGRPVITTDVPGCRETVIDGENGFLIPPQNTEELVKKMIFFIENPEQIILMGKKSREKAEKEFCATTQAEKLFNLIFND